MPLFAYRNQPFKAAYIVHTGLSVLLVRLPYWSLRALVPAWRPRPTWSFGQSVTLATMQVFIDLVYSIGLFPAVLDDPEKSVKSADKLGFVWVEPVPTEYLKGEIASMASINMVKPVRVHGYWYGKDVGRGSHGGKARSDEKVMYHLHGGGYIMASSNPTGASGPGTSNYIKQCTSVFERAFCLDYRLCSAAPFKAENPFPAPLIDALAGYRYLVETLGFKPGNIILSGDSAGAHLAFSLARYLAQESIPNLSPPGALILHSPAGEFSATHNSKPNASMIRNARSDIVGPILCNGYTARALCGSLPEGSVATNAWISPASLLIDTCGFFTNFPPTIIFAGGAEQMVDGIRELYDRLKTDNEEGRITYVEYPDATHDFMLVPFHGPETTQGAQELLRWLGTVYPLQ